MAGSASSFYETDEEHPTPGGARTAVPGASPSTRERGHRPLQLVELRAQASTPGWVSPPELPTDSGSSCPRRALGHFERPTFQGAEELVNPEEAFAERGDGRAVGRVELLRAYGGRSAWRSPRRPWTAGPLFQASPSVPSSVSLAWPSPVPEPLPVDGLSSASPPLASSSGGLRGAAAASTPRPQSPLEPFSRAWWLDDVQSLHSDPTFARPSRGAAAAQRRLQYGNGAAAAFGAAAFAAAGELGVSEELRLGASRFFVGVGRRAADAVRSAGALHHADDAEVETFLCLVCFENTRLEQRLSLHSCQIPEHGCCIECAASFFRARIEQGRVFELVCPIGMAEGGCRFIVRSDGAEIDVPQAPEAGAAYGGNAGVRNAALAAVASRDEVEEVLANDTATLEKYRRFLRTKVDSSLRECPDCRHLCSPVLDAALVPQRDMRCSSCGCSFCYYHAAAHRGGSCEEYEVRLAAETRCISDTLGTKDCPQCARQTMKTGGCNHMTCQVCRCDWCWICGISPVLRGPHGEDPIYWHFCDDNVESGCRQFVDPGRHPDAEAVRLWRRERQPGSTVRRLAAPARLVSVCLVVFSAVLALVLWLIVYMSAVAIAGAAECIARGACRVCGADPSFEDGPFTKSQLLIKPTLYPAVAVGTFVFLVPFIAFSFAWGLLSFIVWAPLWLLGRTPLLRRCVPTATRHHLRFLSTAPLRSVHQFGSSTFARMGAEEVN